MKVQRKDRPPAAPKPSKEPETLVAWGPSPFAPRDEANGTRVAGHRLVRGADGRLYAVADDDPPEDAA